jgi:hypothetical protein
MSSRDNCSFDVKVNDSYYIGYVSETGKKEKRKGTKK